MIGVEHGGDGPGVHQAPAAERAELRRVVEQVEQHDVVGPAACGPGSRARGRTAVSVARPVADEQPGAVRAGHGPGSGHPLDAVPRGGGPGNGRRCGVDAQHAVDEHPGGRPAAPGRAGPLTGSTAAVRPGPPAVAAGAGQADFHVPPLPARVVGTEPGLQHDAGEPAGRYGTGGTARR